MIVMAGNDMKFLAFVDDCRCIEVFQDRYYVCLGEGLQLCCFYYLPKSVNMVWFTICVATGIGICWP